MSPRQRVVAHRGAIFDPEINIDNCALAERSLEGSAP